MNIHPISLVASNTNQQPVQTSSSMLNHENLLQNFYNYFNSHNNSNNSMNGWPMALNNQHNHAQLISNILKTFLPKLNSNENMQNGVNNQLANNLWSASQILLQNSNQSNKKQNISKSNFPLNTIK
jgi:hypothetical protein